MEAEDKEDEDNVFRELFEEKKHIHLNSLAFPIGLDLEYQGLAILGWCEQCKKVRMACMTPLELSHLLIAESGSNGEECDPK